MTRKITTNLLGRRVIPGGECAESVINDETIEALRVHPSTSKNATTESMRNWMEYENKQRVERRRKMWGDADAGLISSVYIEEGKPVYTVELETGKLKEMTDDMFRMAEQGILGILVETEGKGDES